MRKLLLFPAIGLSTLCSAQKYPGTRTVFEREQLALKVLRYCYLTWKNPDLQIDGKPLPGEEEVIRSMIELASIKDNRELAMVISRDVPNMDWAFANQEDVNTASAVLSQDIFELKYRTRNSSREPFAPFRVIAGHLRLPIWPRKAKEVATREESPSWYPEAYTNRLGQDWSPRNLAPYIARLDGRPIDCDDEKKLRRRSLARDCIEFLFHFASNRSDNGEPLDSERTVGRKLLELASILDADDLVDAIRNSQDDFYGNPEYLDLARIGLARIVIQLAFENSEAPLNPNWSLGQYRPGLPVLLPTNQFYSNLEPFLSKFFGRSPTPESLKLYDRIANWRAQGWKRRNLSSVIRAFASEAKPTPAKVLDSQAACTEVARRLLGYSIFRSGPQDMPRPFFEIPSETEMMLELLKLASVQDMNIVCNSIEQAYEDLKADLKGNWASDADEQAATLAFEIRFLWMGPGTMPPGYWPIPVSIQGHMRFPHDIHPWTDFRTNLESARGQERSEEMDLKPFIELATKTLALERANGRRG